MKIQRVYIDTSVIGGCFDAEFAPWSNGLMMDFRLGNLIPVVSQVIDAEIEDGPEHVRLLYEDLQRWPHEFVVLDEAALQLAGAYLKRGIVGSRYADDALHIALATVAEADVLVSWNFRHIVHFEKIRRFNAVNLERGYKPLQIYSPREVTHYGRERAEGD